MSVSELIASALDPTPTQRSGSVKIIQWRGDTEVALQAFSGSLRFSGSGDIHMGTSPRTPLCGRPVDNSKTSCPQFARSTAAREMGEL
jgi:hypothetical protein